MNKNIKSNHFMYKHVFWEFLGVLQYFTCGSRGETTSFAT